MRSVILGIWWYVIFMVALAIYVLMMQAVENAETVHFFVGAIPTVPMLVFGTIDALKKTNNRSATVITFFLMVAVTMITLLINKNYQKHEYFYQPNNYHYIRPYPRTGILVDNSHIFMGQRYEHPVVNPRRNMGSKRDYYYTSANEDLGMGEQRAKQPGSPLETDLQIFSTPRM